MRASRGFTLLEVLAAIVLVSAATVTIVGAVAAPNEAQQLAGVIARVTELDREARALAKSEGCAEIACTDERVLVLSGRTHKEVIASYPMPKGAQLSFWKLHGESARLHEERLRVLRFDASGRTERYHIDASIGTHSRRLIVSGLTGCGIEGGSMIQLRQRGMTLLEVVLALALLSAAVAAALPAMLSLQRALGAAPVEVSFEDLALLADRALATPRTLGIPERAEVASIPWPDHPEREAAQLRRMSPLESGDLRWVEFRWHAWSLVRLERVEEAKR